MAEKLKWETRKVKVKDLIELDINPRKISEAKKQKLIESLEKFNLAEIPAVNTDMQIIGGNQRVSALMLVGRGEEEIDVRVPNRKLTEKEVKEYAIERKRQKLLLKVGKFLCLKKNCLAKMSGRHFC